MANIAVGQQQGDADGDVISQGLVSLRARVQQVSGAGAACYREATRSR